MCGILLEISICNQQTQQTSKSDEIFNTLLEAIKPRGPDSLQIHTSTVPLSSGHTLQVKLASSVLGLRGQGITQQPLEGDHGVLAWNGQVFQGLELGLEENDTAKIFEHLKEENPIELLARLEGP